MKKKILYFVGIPLIVLTYIYCFFFMSIADLLNTRDVHEVKLEAAVGLGTVQHKLNYVIPIA